MKEKNYVSPILDRIRKQTFEEDMVLAHDLALRYVKQVNDMRVFPDKKAVGNLSVFEEALSEEPEDTKNILNMLGKYGSPATVAQPGEGISDLFAAASFPRHYVQSGFLMPGTRIQPCLYCLLLLQSLKRYARAG